MKLCVDCKWSDRNAVVPRCACPRNGINVETGGTEIEYCRVNRLFGWLSARLMGKCGQAARWWEARDAV